MIKGEKRAQEPPAPANIEAERAILGAMLLECTCTARPEWMEQWNVAATLEADDFSLDSHRRIFQRMAELVEGGGQVDIVTLSNRLAEMKEIHVISDHGVAYLASLTEGLPRRPNIAEYVKIVKEKAKLRKLIAVCQKAINGCYEQDTPAAQIIKEMGQELRGK